MDPALFITQKIITKSQTSSALKRNACIGVCGRSRFKSMCAQRVKFIIAPRINNQECLRKATIDVCF